jgi:hypothetical protein
MATVYCMKCKKKVEIKYPVPVTVKGVHEINGVCCVCGTRVFRAAMTPSHSNSPSAQTVMMVSCKKIRTVGQVIGRMPPG